MTAEPSDGQWRRLQQLFDAAQGIPATARKRWLDHECGDDPGLRAELESLLQAFDRLGDFLESPAIAQAGAASAVLAGMTPPDAPGLVGVCLGPYRVIREVGRGGMGIVYLAARADDAFEKLVAVKVALSGLYHPVLRRRFQEERRILAALDHPNIARLLDAGTTPDGLPYVVMEWVEGRPIDDYCREHGLSVRARLELFLAVCAAVQYSHQRLVVHRDIKASNILVDAKGTPKLLDFGIATMLAPGGEGLATTRTTLRALTPECASPEQVRGEPITVASDVYSLGVLLYLLLTDRSPYASRPTSESEIVRAICEEQPPRPSEAVALAPLPAAEAGAEDARAAARRLRHELRGDVDLIVLTALRKEPERRYASAEQLGTDIEHHLNGLPVRAAPDSWSYRAGKFLRRHRVAVPASAAAALAVLAAAGISLEQARIARRERGSAEQRFEMVRRLAHAVVFDFNDALEPVPGATAARRLVVAKAIEYLDGLSRQQPSDPALLRELGAAYLRVGDIQGDPTRPNLGDAAGALDSYSHAFALYERSASVDESAEALSGLAASHRALGLLRWAGGQAAGARSHFAEARRLWEKLSAADPADPSCRRGLADVHYQLGQVELRYGEPAAAEKEYRLAVHLYQDLLDARPNDPAGRRGLAIAYIKLGDAAASLQRDSLVWYRKAAASLDQLARDPGASAGVRRLAALAALRVAEGLTDSAPSEAAGFAAQAIAALEPGVAADPANAQGRGDLAYAYGALGAAEQARGRRREAVEALTRSAGLLEGRLAANPNSADDHRGLGIARMALGEMALERRDVAEAMRLLDSARALLEAPDVRPNAVRLLATLYRDLGDAESVNPHATRHAARERYRKSAALWRELGATRPLDAREADALRRAERAAEGSP